MAKKKVLVILQENTGKVPLPEDLPKGLKKAVRAVIDRLVETFEDLKTHLQGSGKYDRIINLTDTKCTRAGLTKALLVETIRGNTIDLIVIGHGSRESILLHGGKHLRGGESGNLRKMLDDVRTKRKYLQIGGAKARNLARFNLRMVYSITCFGSTLNDDWRAIGAQVAIGPKKKNYMPEPMLTLFVRKWLNGKRAANAARKAYEDSIPFYQVVYPPKVIVKYKKIIVEYPCPTWSNPLKMCRKKVEVPDGFETKTNRKILDSAPVVSGNGSLKF